MASHLIKTGELSVRRQGKGAQHDSLLNNPAIKSAVQNWVRGLLLYDKGGFNGWMKPHKLRRYVNEFLLPKMKIEDTISKTTAVQWLKKLGFSLSRVQKGVYVDGHERPGVVEARKEMINYMYTSGLLFCYTYKGPDCIEIAPTLPEGSKIHYPIFHDKTCVHANDLNNFVWLQEGEQPLRSKSRSRIIHISNFILKHCGQLSLSADEIAEEMKLPARPSPPPPPGSIPKPPAEEPAPADTLAAKGKEKGIGKGTKKVPKPKKAPKEKNTRTATTEGRSFTQHDGKWIPPPPPAPFTRYCIHSFDARQITTWVPTMIPGGICLN
ncbi:hypothetical protein B0H34DRAFT_198739 [Crassisporium funariophilum]|nr:hypothetical protein B0H34DRAFT_198739 [Crassisporium funariophilum]